MEAHNILWKEAIAILDLRGVGLGLSQERWEREYFIAHEERGKRNKALKKRLKLQLNMLLLKIGVKEHLQSYRTLA